MQDLGGRPTKYLPEYCQQLIDHMKQGFSFESFAGLIEVNQDTLYEWVKVHPDFSEAKKLGRALCQLMWERIGLEASKGRVENFSASAWIFNMKNRFKWTDRTESTHTVLQNQDPKKLLEEAEEAILELKKEFSPEA